MIDNLTSADVANNISMLRSAHKGPIVVVEGVTDCRLYSKFIDRGEVKIVSAYSKDNVRRSVTEVWGRRNDKKIIGILDADIDRLCRKTYRPPIFITDKRDLETMIMSTGALDAVLAEYSDLDLLEAFENEHGAVRDVLARSTYPIGLLMFISSRDRLGLNFKNMDHLYFINRKTLAIDIRKMIDEVFSQSMNKSHSKKELADLISEEEELLDDPWIAARGHDAVSVLSIGLSEIFGSYNSRGMKDGQLSGALRLAFGLDYFESTDLYKETTEWSRKNNFTLWITQ
ncbi:MAG: DUF4435 domain-containing protein [Candidatus Methanoplasma sp.]|jgi:hypothetical protein|nr:DUF4435 domain-containing protein [Candidatus Methanoplasma sp.]